ncbi:MAG: serine protease Do [Planctomycetota bacterium]|jgi:serine protease Do
MRSRKIERLALILFMTVVFWRLPEAARALQNWGSDSDLTKIRQQLETEALPPMANAFAKVAAVMAPSVVHVSVIPDGLPGESFPRPITGSGVIFTKAGHVLTNYHVVETKGKISLTLSDDRKINATLVGGDKATDLAVLKLDGDGYIPAVLGDSDALQVGDFVLACGSPFGLSRSVTAGIVSAKGRTDIGVASYENFIQTDAAINPGNSGGPLCDLRGRVIGINAAIASRTGGYAGIGFAIPVKMAKEIAGRLIQGGQVDRGYLGVRIANLRDSKTRPTQLPLGYSGAVVVAEVVKGGPAAKAGVVSGDLVVTIAGKKMLNANTLRNYVAFLEAGKTVRVEVLRKNKLIALDVVLALRED